MKNILRHYSMMPQIVISVALPLLLNGIVWVIATILALKSNGTAVLHYTANLGIDFIGQGFQIFTIPLAGLLLLILNTSIGWLLYRIEARGSWLLWTTTILNHSILLASLIALVRFN